MTEQLKCDLSCGRKAVVKVGRLNLCERCADENPDGDRLGPRLRLEDVVMPDRPVGDEIV
jgi:hypothetical protein